MDKSVCVYRSVCAHVFSNVVIKIKKLNAKWVNQFIKLVFAMTVG